MQFFSAPTLVSILTISSSLAAPLRARGESSSEDPASSIIGSVVGTGTDNAAGNLNSAWAASNGNSNTGATAGASNFLNGASATDNGVGDGNDGNSFISFKRSTSEDPASQIIGSVVGAGSGNAAGDGNTATGKDNGNGNTGASASSGDFLNWASATDNGVGNGNDGNSFISLKRSSNDEVSDETSQIIGSVVDTGSSNTAGDGNTATGKDNGNGNTGASASSGNFLNGASATGNGVGNDNDGNSFISLRKRSNSWQPADTATNTIGSVTGTGSSNSAGNANSASGTGNGNSNTGASASAWDFLNDSSATDNGVGDGNDDNSFISLKKRVAQLEAALLQKRSLLQ